MKERLTLCAGFSAEPIPDSVWQRMQGRTYKTNSIIGRKDLRLVKVRHIGFDGTGTRGELIVARELALDVMNIFKELYDAGYQIEKLRLCDEYDGSDDRSMADNNSSAFNFRTVDSTDTLSLHALGRAIDINPLYNPYIVGEKIMPPEGAEFCSRDREFMHKIDHEDICFKIFRSHGWLWGGDWSRDKDYQHFYKPRKNAVKALVRRVKRMTGKRYISKT
ncbi:MAG: M15 family metallopeptidase [Ruminococcus sp.]|nr:M15 family metallopeptidase [Ruminococcus sp.]